KQIFGLLFEQQFQQHFPSMQLTTEIPFARVRILDGTTISLPDQCGEDYPGTVDAGVKYQIEFDYLKGRFLYIDMQPGKAGDSSAGMKRLESVQKNDLACRILAIIATMCFVKLMKKELIMFHGHDQMQDSIPIILHPVTIKTAIL